MDAHPPNVGYTPQQNYMDEDSFTFKANDGKADSNIGTVRINVEKGNAHSQGSYYGTPAS
jgi:hypothetical protein